MNRSRRTYEALGAAAHDEVADESQPTHKRHTGTNPTINTPAQEDSTMTATTAPTFGPIEFATADSEHDFEAAYIEISQDMKDRHSVSIDWADGDDGRGKIVVSPPGRSDTVAEAAGESIRTLAEALLIIQRALNAADREAQR